MKPSHTINLNSYMQKKHGHLLEPEVTPTNTPQKDIFTPAKDILNMKPQEIFSPKIPELDFKDRQNLIFGAIERSKKMKAGKEMIPFIKREKAQKNLMDFKEINNEASKINRAYKSAIAKRIVKAKRIEKNEAIVLSEAPKARLSDVHVTTRPGATKTRTFDKNQQISELIQQQPARQGSETAISNATTPAKGRLNALKPLPSPDLEVKRGRGRPSSGPKPMRIEYEIPGRPKLQPDPGAKTKEKRKITFKLHINFKKIS